MPKYLSAEWLDMLVSKSTGQPERPGSTARIQYLVTGGAEGDIQYYWLVEDGKLNEAKLGELPDADVTLALSWEDASKVQRGELDANAAFMQGRMRVTGNVGKLMALLPITTSAEYRELQAEVAAETEF